MLNSFDWDEYGRCEFLRKNEDPRTIIDKFSYWYYISYSY